MLLSIDIGQLIGGIFTSLGNAINSLGQGLSDIKQHLGSAPLLFKSIFDEMPNEFKILMTIGVSVIVIGGILNALRGRK